ncbi:MAG TPA: tetratricopeptide repeat protein [Dehalococcoidia bacterium]|nr:tetratricopeptide repeat protein [Dehalococcoidia bacterium]
MLGRLRSLRFSILVAAGLAIVIGGVTAYLLISRDQPGELVEREVARLEKVVAQNPDDPDKRVELALFYYEAGSLEQATDQLKAALELDGSHQGALVALGDIYMEQGRYEEALEPYLKVVELNEDNPLRGVSRQLEGVYYYLGVAYFNLEKPEKAIEYLEEALSIDRTDADAWYTLGATYQHTGELEKAIESFKQAVRFVPNFAEAYQGLAQCYKKTGQEGLARYAEAMVSYSSGATGKAVRQLEEVVAIMPDLADAYLGLGLAYEKEGQIEKAISAYQQALNLDPDIWLAQAKLQALGVGKE